MTTTTTVTAVSDEDLIILIDSIIIYTQSDPTFFLKFYLLLHKLHEMNKTYCWQVNNTLYSEQLESKKQQAARINNYKS